MSDPKDTATPGERSRTGRGPRTIAVTSGKGGVGKTTVVINLALTLARRGHRVLVMDCDLGLSNVDVLMGLNPRFNLIHVMRGEQRLDDVLLEASEGVCVLPAPFGNQEITALTAEEQLSLLTTLEDLEDRFDYILLDTGAGISSNVLFFNMAANHIVVVMTPEPTSVTDAYALIKVLNTRHSEERFHLFVNRVRSDAEGLTYFRKLTQVTQNFLDVSVGYMGCLLRDVNIGRGTMACRATVTLYPRSDAAKRFDDLAARLEALPLERPKGNIQFLLGQMLKTGEEAQRIQAT